MSYFASCCQTENLIGDSIVTIPYLELSTIVSFTTGHIKAKVGRNNLDTELWRECNNRRTGRRRVCSTSVSGSGKSDPANTLCDSIVVWAICINTTTAVVGCTRTACRYGYTRLSIPSVSTLTAARNKSFDTDTVGIPRAASFINKAHVRETFFSISSLSIRALASGDTVWMIRVNSSRSPKLQLQPSSMLQLPSQFFPMWCTPSQFVLELNFWPRTWAVHSQPCCLEAMKRLQTLVNPWLCMKRDYMSPSWSVQPRRNICFSAILSNVNGDSLGSKGFFCQFNSFISFSCSGWISLGSLDGQVIADVSHTAYVDDGSQWSRTPSSTTNFGASRHISRKPILGHRIVFYVLFLLFTLSLSTRGRVKKIALPRFQKKQTRG